MGFFYIFVCSKSDFEVGGEIPVFVFLHLQSGGFFIFDSFKAIYVKHLKKRLQKHGLVYCATNVVNTDSIESSGGGSSSDCITF